jgi:hypothetical protein
VEDEVEAAVSGFLALVMERAKVYGRVNILVLLEHDNGQESISTMNNAPGQRGMLEMAVDAMKKRVVGQRTEVVAVDPANPDEDFKGRPN